jgi:PAS domain S-box-containing protein
VKEQIQVQANNRLLAELEQRNQAFYTLVELLGEVVFCCAEDGTLELLNPAWSRALGYADASSLGQPIYDFIENEDARQLLREQLQTASRISDEVGVKTQSGHVALMILRARRRNNKWYGSLYDLSTQQLILKQRAESQNQVRKLSLVAQRTDNIVIITGADGKVEWVNDGFVEKTGYQLQDAVGISPGQLLQGPDTAPEAIHHMRQCIAEQKSFNVEIINYTRSGEPFWTAIDCSPVFDDAGALINFIAIERDISVQKAQEESLREAKENAELLSAARTRFVANMSHEIRTPLNSILGMSSVLANTQLSAEQRTCIETIANGGNALLALVDDILDFAKIESGQFQFEHVPFSACSVFEEAVNIVAPSAHDKSLKLFLKCSGLLPSELVGDPHRTRQVLLNLLSNAIKFTAEGTVIIDVSWRPINGDSGMLKISVSDTGMGIPATRVATLFDEFSQVDASVTRRHGGTGLGLAICRQICEQSGGSISVESQLGVGSVFTVDMVMGGVLPEDAGLDSSAVEIVDGNAAPDVSDVLRATAKLCNLDYRQDPNADGDLLCAQGDVLKRHDLAALQGVYTPSRVAKLIGHDLQLPSAVNDLEPGGSTQKRAELRILIAEDVLPNQLVLCSMLKQLGIEQVVVVENGAEAVAEIRKAPYDVVFLDIHMPVLDGLSAAALLTEEEKASLQLVALSADVGPEAREKASKVGVHHWLSKPITLVELESLFSSLMRPAPYH